MLVVIKLMDRLYGIEMVGSNICFPKDIIKQRISNVYYDTKKDRFLNSFISEETCG